MPILVMASARPFLADRRPISNRSSRHTFLKTLSSSIAEPAASSWGTRKVLIVVYAIESEIGGVFVPVRDVEAARDWYCRLLSRVPDGDVLFGHLFVVTMKGSTALLLDSKDFQGPHVSKPVFHFNTRNLEAARSHALSVGAANVSPIVDDAFFTFNDPDGNLLMTASVHPAPRFNPEEPPSVASASDKPV